MANSIKESADGLALQVTRPARKAELVTEDADGNATRLAGVYVYGFDDVVLVVDAESVSAAHRADLVAQAARDTESVHRGAAASVQIAGNGYQVQLPGCKAAGFSVGDRAPAASGQGILVIHDGTQGRLVDELVTRRAEQTAN
jgi:hypothetical protein